MSAYLVHENQIAAMVRAATRLLPRYYENFTWGHLPGESIKNCYDVKPSEQEIAAASMLYAANAESVAARYCEEAEPIVVAAFWPSLQWRPNPIKILKVVSNYEYQACESPAWETSSAKRFCDLLKSICIEALPGYSEAKWGVESFSDCE